MNNKPTYFQMPNFETPPDSLVRLGQIIHDFKDPTSAVAPPPAPSSLQHIPVVHIHVQSDWQSTRKNLLGGSIGVYTQFLASILGFGADVSMLLGHEKGEILKFDQLDTTFIDPGLDYIRAAMSCTEALHFYQDNARAPAFMVTGIKVARGGAIEKLRRVKYGVECNAGVNLTSMTGVPVELGPQASFVSDTTISTGFSGSSDFVFAYRLRKINRTRSQTIQGTKPYIKGAVHDLADAPSVAKGGVLEMYSVSQSAFRIVGIDAEDFGDELLYAKYRLLDVNDSGEELHCAEDCTTARVLIKGP
jgi:hypothetical protein